MAVVFNFTQTMDLADTNKVRFRDDAAGFILLGVKIGAGAVQEVKISKTEAAQIVDVLNALQIVKRKDIA